MSPKLLNYGTKHGSLFFKFYIRKKTLHSFRYSTKNIMLRSFRDPINESEVKCPSLQSHKNIITDLNDVQNSLRVTHLKIFI